MCKYYLAKIALFNYGMDRDPEESFSNCRNNIKICEFS